MKRRTRATLSVLLLLTWQVSAGIMPEGSSVHAHHVQAATGDVQADGGSAAEAEVPCHGLEEPTAAELPEPQSGTSPCCQSDACDGGCFVSPAIPARPAIPPVVLRVAWPAPVHHRTSVPVFPAELFRPPI